MAQDLDDPRLTREINKKIGHNRLDDSIYKHRERADHFKENAALNPRRHALAGLAVGFWSGVEEVAKAWKCERSFEPMMSPQVRAKLYAGWQKAVERAKGWVNPKEIYS